MDSAATYDPVPASQQISFSPPPLVAQALADTNGIFRVDGYRALGDNYGSLYGLMDIRGISPLFMSGPHAIIQRALINPQAWELFAVRYVYTDWEQLPVESSVISEGEDRLGAVRMHRLENPRPFASLIYQAEVIPQAEAAFALLTDESIDLRSTVILEQEPGIELNSQAEGGQVEVVDFQPERIRLRVNSPEAGLLSLAIPYYPGWTATANGEETPILKAYTALMAIPVRDGESEIVLGYDPVSYRLGAGISLVAWLLLLSIGLVLTYPKLKQRRPAPAR
jgi:hypothetical protein